MKALSFVLFCVIFFGCNEKDNIPYQIGIEKCKASRKSLTDPKTNSTISIPPDASLLVGVQLPNFEAKTLTGKVIDENYFKGKISIINFWFMGCEPCVAEIPGFNEIMKKFGNEKVNYLAIGKDKPADIDEFLKEHPWDFDIVASGNELIYKDFQFQWGYPFTFLVDENATIVKVISGGKTDDKASQEIQDNLIPTIQELVK